MVSLAEFRRPGTIAVELSFQSPSTIDNALREEGGSNLQNTCSKRIYSICVLFLAFDIFMTENMTMYITVPLLVGKRSIMSAVSKVLDHYFSSPKAHFLAIKV